MDNERDPFLAMSADGEVLRRAPVIQGTTWANHLEMGITAKKPRTANGS
jgi:hypothetical protein